MLRKEVEKWKKENSETLADFPEKLMKKLKEKKNSFNKRKLGRHILNREIHNINLKDIIEIKDRVKTQYTINPKDYGITGKNIDSIKTSNEKSSLDFIFSVINNEESDAKEICILNAALSVMLYKDIELNDSIEQCRESLSEYKVRDKFNQYIDFTNQI